MNKADKVIAATLVISSILLCAFYIVTGLNPLIYGMVVTG